MIKITLRFRDGKIESYKSHRSIRTVLMCHLSWDFCNKECRIGENSLERFYSTGLSKVPVYLYFGAKLTEEPIDGRSSEAKKLPYFTVSVFSGTYRK